MSGTQAVDQPATQNVPQDDMQLKKEEILEIVNETLAKAMSEERQNNKTFINDQINAVMTIQTTKIYADVQRRIKDALTRQRADAETNRDIAIETALKKKLTPTTCGIFRQYKASICQVLAFLIAVFVCTVLVIDAGKKYEARDKSSIGICTLKGEERNATLKGDKRYLIGEENKGKGKGGEIIPSLKSEENKGKGKGAEIISGENKGKGKGGENISSLKSEENKGKGKGAENISSLKSEEKKGKGKGGEIISGENKGKVKGGEIISSLKSDKRNLIDEENKEKEKGDERELQCKFEEVGLGAIWYLVVAILTVVGLFENAPPAFVAIWRFIKYLFCK